MSFSAILATIAILVAFRLVFENYPEWERHQLSAVFAQLDEWFPPETRPTTLEACLLALHAAVVLFIGALVVGSALGVLGFAARCVLGGLGFLARSILRTTGFLIACLERLLGFLGHCALAFFGLLRGCGGREDGVKMMKAPGGGGAMMPRSSFEDNPGGYFRGRRGGNAASAS